MVNKRTKKNKPKGTQNRGPPRPRRAIGLDKAGLDHAKLLLDPCGAKLSHPVYSGAEGGYLIRSESFSRNFVSVGTTAGVFHWTPGAVSSNDTELLYTDAPNSGAGVAAATIAAAPGKAFLQNASMCRCVAACIKIGFTGTEGNRSGRIHYGRTSATLVNPGDVISVDGLAGALPYYSRTPVSEIEVLWLPNDGDQLFHDPNEAITAEARRRLSSITIAASDLPSGVGLTFRMTAIYEWQPVYNTGVAVPANSRAQSNSTLDQVINVVQRAMNGAASAAGNTVGQVLSAGARGVLAGAMSSMYGMIPTLTTTRSPQMIGYY